MARPAAPPNPNDVWYKPYGPVSIKYLGDLNAFFRGSDQQPLEPAQAPVPAGPGGRPRAIPAIPERPLRPAYGPHPLFTTLVGLISQNASQISKLTEAILRAREANNAIVVTNRVIGTGIYFNLFKELVPPPAGNRPDNGKVRETLVGFPTYFKIGHLSIHTDPNAPRTNVGAFHFRSDIDFTPAPNNKPLTDRLKFRVQNNELQVQDVTGFSSVIEPISRATPNGITLLNFKEIIINIFHTLTAKHVLTGGKRGKKTRRAQKKRSKKTRKH
jgi:hypothetical protein